MSDYVTGYPLYPGNSVIVRSAAASMVELQIAEALPNRGSGVKWTKARNRGSGVQGRLAG
jgi:hypothetical protein